MYEFLKKYVVEILFIITNSLFIINTDFNNLNTLEIINLFLMAAALILIVYRLIKYE